MKSNALMWCNGITERGGFDMEITKCMSYKCSMGSTVVHLKEHHARMLMVCTNTFYAIGFLRIEYPELSLSEAKKIADYFRSAAVE
jgi:hypothetical protein